MRTYFLAFALSLASTSVAFAQSPTTDKSEDMYYVNYEVVETRSLLWDLRHFSDFQRFNEKDIQKDIVAKITDKNLQTELTQVATTRAYKVVQNCSEIKQEKDKDLAEFYCLERTFNRLTGKIIYGTIGIVEKFLAYKTLDEKIVEPGKKYTVTYSLRELAYINRLSEEINKLESMARAYRSLIKTTASYSKWKKPYTASFSLSNLDGYAVAKQKRSAVPNLVSNIKSELPGILSHMLLLENVNKNLAKAYADIYAAKKSGKQ